MIKIVFIIDLSTIFHSDFKISGDVALKVFVDVGTTFEETFAITIKHINKIAIYFTTQDYQIFKLCSIGCC